MVLVDTSVWIDHFRNNNIKLTEILISEEVSCHPFIIGELACGNIKNRKEILSLLKALPTLPKAGDEEILFFIETHNISGKGLGLIDVHLLASCLFKNAALWTLDRKLKETAILCGIEAF
ncbi:MAG TPA: VapC toxin family PIN domain ribonuclease [Lentisphaeria bacterium]|nr:MAG: ribonuclease [Lentisphaerae bacterium GWF2_49_21]HBC88634.1 VapC toxin family PIN domain ribonuclease [Lentisphaeria bacterium]